MTEHQCVHEDLWGELRADLRNLKESIDKLNGVVIDKLNGVVVRSELNKSSITRLWWFVGGIAIIFLGIGVRSWFF
jgi:hypothetical protein